jgi:hypothetical protein
VFAIRTALAIALFLTTAAVALASPPSHKSPAGQGTDSTSMRIDAGCAGDTITGTVTMLAPAGETYRLELYFRRQGRAAWSATGRSASFRGDGAQHSYTYNFDVSAFNAFAYRLDMSGEHAWSRTIPAASCAPGRQVPEAPYALLLPLSLLATSGLLLRRRHARVN